MRKHLFLLVIAAAALTALLFACDLSSGDDPAEETGSVEVEVRGATPVADPTNLPAQIDCRLVQGGSAVSSWSVLPAAFTAVGTSFTFTQAGLPVGDYTLEVDLHWPDDPGVAECTGTSAALSIAKGAATPVVVDVTPVEFVDLPYPGKDNSWYPGTADPDQVVDTPTGSDDYRPHWYRIGPLPAGAGDAFSINVGVTDGSADLYVLHNGAPLGAPVMDMTATAYYYFNLAEPPEGYVWACVYGDPAGASYRIKFVYTEP